MRALAAIAVLTAACTPFGAAEPAPVGSGPASAPSPSAGADGGDGAPDGGSCFALGFDGVSTYVEVPDAADLDPTGSSTIEAWVNLAETSAGELHVLAHHAHYGLKGYVLMAFDEPSDGGPPLLGGCTRYYDGTTMHQVGFGAASLLPGGRWVHLAASYDEPAGTIRLYVDGEQRAVETGLKVQANKDFGGVLRIGMDAQSTKFKWVGLIDEVRISRVARYTAAKLVPSPRFSDDADTIALWHFDEGSGATATDVHAKHIGAITGGKWVPAPCNAR